MDIRFWAGATTACTVARWNNDVAYEPWSKLYLPLDGQARYAVARAKESPRWTNLRPGRLYLIPGGRRQINATRTPFNLAWCHFTLNDANLLARIAALDGLVELPGDLLPNCQRRLAECWIGESQQHAACALVFDVLSRLPAGAIDSLAGERRRLADAVFALEYRFDRHPAIAELAAKAGLAPSRFQDLFRQVHGTSVHGYRLALRVAEAKRLLETSEGSVREIAAHCGYPNPFNFTRMFTRRCGCSPTVWRQRERRQVGS